MTQATFKSLQKTLGMPLCAILIGMAVFILPSVLYSAVKNYNEIGRYIGKTVWEFNDESYVNISGYN